MQLPLQLQRCLLNTIPKLASSKESDYEMVSNIWNYMPKSSTKKN